METFDSLRKLIHEFDVCCPPDNLVNVSLGNNLPPMVLYNIACVEPDILIFDFATYDRKPCRIIQHMSQLNLAISYVDRPKEVPRRKIGFKPLE